jgi:hypothetical protein
MPRKEKKAKRIKATKITPVVSDATKPFGKEVQETIDVEEANTFQKLCMDVSETLRSEEGKNLNCRLRVVVENHNAIVYQGLLGNVWGRIRADGRHQIYRHALKNLLAGNPKTKSIVG